MDLAEEMVKYLVRDIRENCPDELGLFAKFVDKELLARLEFVVERPFQRISYTKRSSCSQKSGAEVRVPGRVRPQPAIRTRALADRETFQMSGHGLQLPEGN